MKRILKFSVVFSLFLCLLPTTVLAGNIDKPFVITMDGETYQFESKKDYYQNSKNAKSDYDYMPTVISTATLYYSWIGYHSLTPNWSKASSYTLNQGASRSANGSVIYLGVNVNINISYTQSVATAYK